MNIGEPVRRRCNGAGNCSYQFMDGMGFGCNYKNYCDYQLPRDSRSQADLLGHFILPKDNCLEAIENLTKQKEDKSDAK